MFERSNFHTKVFLLYSILAMAIIVLLSAAFYAYIYNTVRSDSRNFFVQVVHNTSLNIDRLITGLDAMSTQLIANRELQEISERIAEEPEDAVNYFEVNLDDKRDLQGIFLSINSPIDKVRKISIVYSPEDVVSVGGNIIEYSDGLPDSIWDEWRTAFRDSRVFYRILPPSSNEDDTLTSPVTFSLIRPLKAVYTNYRTLGFIELQQDYSRIEKICNFSEVGDGYRLYIIDAEENIVYPYKEGSVDDARMYLKAISQVEPGEIFPFENTEEGREEMICYSNIESYHWHVILVQPKKVFMEPVLEIFRLVLLLGLVFIAISLSVVFVSTRALTKPIRELRESVKSASIENPRIGTSTNHNEVELLKDAFNEMILQLQESANKVVQSRSSELHAHFLALQAQINPHFLYNSIMSISAAGQEAGSRKVQTMCSQLGEHLRYIASTDEPDGQPVTLNEEILHARVYLDFIKWRYEDRLGFKLDIPEDMSTLHVPKLVLQPVIENCISHGFVDVRPPIRISIKGSADHESWRIEVRDNGNGFSNSALDELKNQIASIDSSIAAGRFINDFRFGGMALINIYSRLRLLYGTKAIFSAGNAREGGARVIIGGLQNAR